MADDVKPQMPTPDFHASRLDNASDLERVRVLFELNGYPRSGTEIAWIYESLGVDAPFASLAVAGDVVAALYATVPARFKCGEQTLLAAQSLDTMVDSRFRGMGLFTRMARDVYARMKEQGVGFVYGFPNGNSFHGFVNKLGWSALDPVPFLFRPLDTGYALGKINAQLGRFAKIGLPVLGARGNSRELPALPPASELDGLWDAFSAQLRIARVRDSAFLDKRYARHPRARYRYRACYRDNCLAGLVIYCIEDKHGGRIGYVMELMCLPGADKVASDLLVDTLRDMRAAGCNGALAWCFGHSPYHGRYLRQGFMPLPTRLRPIELHFGVCALAGAGSAELSRREDWYVSYGDSDTV